jgi:hypothetical protein
LGRSPTAVRLPPPSSLLRLWPCETIVPPTVTTLGCEVEALPARMVLSRVIVAAPPPAWTLARSSALAASAVVLPLKVQLIRLTGASTPGLKV